METNGDRIAEHQLRELLDALPKLELLIVQDLFPGPLSAAAQIVLPGCSFAEKDGVFVNSQNRAQLVRRALDPLAHGHDDLSILQRVQRAAGAAVVARPLATRRCSTTRAALGASRWVSHGRQAISIRCQQTRRF